MMRFKSFGTVWRFIAAFIFWVAVGSLLFAFYVSWWQFQGESTRNKIRFKLLGRHSCAPRKHIYFLKTHKCGSSTIQNILMRWGVQNQLNFALPREGHYLGHPQHLSRDFVESRWYTDGQKTIQILAHHSRFSAAGVADVMPGDAFRFTVLREPAALFESLFGYYEMEKIEWFGGSLRSFLDFLNSSEYRNHPPLFDRLGMRIGINQMAFDLGMSERDFGDKQKVMELISVVEEEFDLVLITERMDESLVLLAEALCWPLEAFASLRLNARPPGSHAKITKEDRRTLRALNAADVAFYEHFQKKFQRRVLQFGQRRMDEQVRQLRAIHDETAKLCVQREAVPEKSFQVVNFEVRSDAPDYCRLMTMPELQCTQLLRKTQLQRYSIDIDT